MKPRRLLLAELIAAALAAPPASAVYLNPDGHGQALIFPYYTVQSAGGGAFNTLISIRNQTGDAKVAKIHFREGRNAQEVMAFDIYLSPNDMWTAGLVPATADPGAPALLVTADPGCTNPRIPAGGIDFRNYMYAAAPDNSGLGVDRTREGYFEVIEMATIGGASAAAISRDANGVPANCGAVQGPSAPTGLGPPTGGLSGTATLINVANGVDFGMNAEALADLTRVQMYRSFSDATPVDFNSPEIDPVSHVALNGAYYRSTWSRPADAVSAVLMRTSLMGEFVVDSGSRSRTGVVMTFPTKRHYVTTTTFAPPFTAWFRGYPVCAATPGETMGENFRFFVFDREGRGLFNQSFPDPAVATSSTMCTAAAIVTIARFDDTITVLGSANRAFGGNLFSSTAASNEHGSFRIEPASRALLTSLPTSTRTDFATGLTVTGPHAYQGLPVVGFWVRTFENGTLDCNGARCQGNYGGAFPLVYKRSITP